QPARAGEPVVIVNRQPMNFHAGPCQSQFSRLLRFGNRTHPPIFAAAFDRFPHARIGDRKKLDLPFGNQLLQQFINRKRQVHPFRVRPNQFQLHRAQKWIQISPLSTFETPWGNMPRSFRTEAKADPCSAVLTLPPSVPPSLHCSVQSSTSSGFGSYLIAFLFTSVICWDIWHALCR